MSTTAGEALQTNPDTFLFWVIGCFGTAGKGVTGLPLRLFGHPEREQLEWWLDGLRSGGMSGLKSITRIMGPMTEDKMRTFIKATGDLCQERGEKAGVQYEILAAVRVVLPWERVETAK